MLLDHYWVFGLGLAGFLVLWPISLWRHDASIVDFWWGPGIGVMALTTWAVVGKPADGATLALLLPILLWSGRLGIHLGARRLAEGEEDPRYAELRRRHAPGWSWKSLFMIFLLQGVLQLLVAAGALAAIARAPLGDLSAAVFLLSAIAVVAVGLQTVSDLQLDAYRRKVPSGGLLTTGLRRIVRYPSYACEIVFWLAIALIASLSGVWWALLPALLITGLLRYVSGVAILEERLSRTRPEFAAYRRVVPALIPNRVGLQQLGQALIE